MSLVIRTPPRNKLGAGNDRQKQKKNENEKGKEEEKEKNNKKQRSSSNEGNIMSKIGNRGFFLRLGF